MVFDERIIRFAQDDEPYYGKQLWAFEITELSPARNQEEPLCNGSVLAAGEEGWSNKGIFYANYHLIAPDSWQAYVGGHGELLVFGSQY